jgi:hypothetical protein
VSQAEPFVALGLPKRLGEDASPYPFWLCVDFN